MPATRQPFEPQMQHVWAPSASHAPAGVLANDPSTTLSVAALSGISPQEKRFANTMLAIYAGSTIVAGVLAYRAVQKLCKK